MTVEWSRYAQSQTSKPMKAMLTGPVTILQWSFVRDDQPRSATCTQIALALRDEVMDLEAAGIPIVQVDEPAIRELLEVALALRGGCDMGVGRFTTGPVVGVEMQQVNIYGFTETGTTGVTSRCRKVA